jgi:hypothetical protein
MSPGPRSFVVRQSIRILAGSCEAGKAPFNLATKRQRQSHSLASQRILSPLRLPSLSMLYGTTSLANRKAGRVIYLFAETITRPVDYRVSQITPVDLRNGKNSPSIICETPSRFGGPSDASGYALQKSNLIELPNCAAETLSANLLRIGFVSAVMLLRSQNSSVKRTSNPFSVTQLSEGEMTSRL